MKNRWYIQCLLFTCHLFLWGQVRIVTFTPTSIILEFSLDTGWVDTGGEFHSVPTLSNELDGQPVHSDILIDVPSDAEIVTYVIREQELERAGINPPPADQSKGLENTLVISPKPGLAVSQFAWLEQGPVIRGHVSSKMSIHPYDNTGVIPRLILNATIQLNWDQPQGQKPQLLSKTSFSRIVKKGTVPTRYRSVIPDYQYSEHLLSITVDTTDWYHLSYSDLADSLDNIHDINPTTFQLWEGRQEKLLYVRGEDDSSFNPGDEIIFSGHRPSPPVGVGYQSNFYTKKNVYWLTWGGSPGRRYVSESGYPEQPGELTLQPNNFRYTLHIEKNQYFSRLGSMGIHTEWDQFEHFFMDPPIYAGNLESFTFHVPAPRITETATATIRLALQGITSSTHSVKFLINDHLIGSGVWNDQQRIILEGVLTQDILQDGENTLILLNEELPDASNRYDMVLLDWFDLDYDRLFVVDRGKIAFTRETDLDITTQFEIFGFSSPDILLFKEGLSRLDDFLVTAISNGYTIIFQDNTGPPSPIYHALETSDLRDVTGIRTVQPLLSWDAMNPANYIIIAPDSFRVILQPLIDFHQATFVDIDWIYRAYSGGVISPRAVKSFLKDVWQQWSPSPEYVLLAMQGKWMGWSGPSSTDQPYLPAMRIQTTGFGAVSSDYWYTLVEGDDLSPEFAIGRFPAANKSELSVMVAKTMAALNQPPQQWHSQVLNIGGYEAAFKEQSEILIRREIEQGFFPLRLYIDRYSEGGPHYGTTDSLIHYFNKGLSYVNFLGHGGGAVWGDRSLLRLEDVSGIANGDRLPFVTSMTCFTGDVTNPNALSRRMLTEENGSLAWFGSSGVGWIINDFLLLQPIHTQLFGSLPLSLGDIINQGKIQYLAATTEYPNISVSQVYQYNLAGDPALTLSRPAPFPGMTEPRDPEPGEEVSLTGLVHSDSLSLQFYNNECQSSVKYPESSTGSFTIPAGTPPGNYYLTWRGKEENAWYSRSDPLRVAGTAIEWLAILPETPDWTDSIQIRIRAQDRQGIDSLWLVMNGIKTEYFRANTEDEYSLNHPLSGLPPLSINELIVRCKDGAGNWSESRGPALRIGGPLQVSVESLDIISEDSIYIRAIARNENSEQGDATLALYKQGDTGWEEQNSVRVTFSGQRKISEKFPSILAPGPHTYRIVLTPVNRLNGTHIDSVITTLQSSYFWSTPELGTTTDFNSHAVLGLDQTTLEILPGSHGQPILFSYFQTSCEETFQSGLRPVSSATVIAGINGAPYNLTLMPDSSAQDSVILYCWYPDYGEWLPYHSTAETIPIPISSGEDGTYAFFTCDDQKKPRLEAAINGQRFMSGMYVSRNPRIQFTAFDENGIDPRQDEIFITIDDVEQDGGMIRNITVNNGHLSFECIPDLNELNQSLTVMIKDAVGNQSEPLRLQFTVFQKLDLIDYGNFPNPFVDQTRFAYELTETVDDLQLAIYSIDGRLVQTFDEESSMTALDPRVGAFHEIVWDGRDRNGDFVGNGVYFYRLVAKKGDQKLIRTGKVAKAR
ncbi:MAG: C25 family cysteine peptidase [Fidelibacterota bacterium]